jgi:hypothetical protein
MKKAQKRMRQLGRTITPARDLPDPAHGPFQAPAWREEKWREMGVGEGEGGGEYILRNKQTDAPVAPVTN